MKLAVHVKSTPTHNILTV